MPTEDCIPRVTICLSVEEQEDQEEDLFMTGVVVPICVCAPILPRCVRACDPSSPHQLSLAVSGWALALASHWRRRGILGILGIPWLPHLPVLTHSLIYDPDADSVPMIAIEDIETFV